MRFSADSLAASGSASSASVPDGVALPRAVLGRGLAAAGRRVWPGAPAAAAPSARPLSMSSPSVPAGVALPRAASGRGLSAAGRGVRPGAPAAAAPSARSLSSNSSSMSSNAPAMAFVVARRHRAPSWRPGGRAPPGTITGGLGRCSGPVAACARRSRSTSSSSLAMSAGLHIAVRRNADGKQP